MTLSGLSRTFPNEEEVKQLYPLILTENDRSCAMLLGGLVEAGVHMACAARMVDDSDILDAMFHAVGAPLGTFAAKIRAALSLGMYGPVTAENLNIVKDIRNTFAHALRPLDFSHPTIVEACMKLSATPLPELLSDSSPSRVRFTAYCLNTFNALYEKAKLEGNAEIKYELP